MNYYQPQTKSQKNDKEIFRRIFVDHWSGFKEIYQSYGSRQYEEVVQKMLDCRKESGGYTEYMCVHCGEDSRRIPFSCKSLFCLSCSKVYVDNFVAQVSQVLHPGVTYRHIVLTLPEQFRIYFYRTRDDKRLLSSFMRCGYDCLESVLSNVKRKKLKIGAIVVIQTHGRSGHYNPHLHILMTSGGIDEDSGKWLDLKFLKYEIIHKKWQYYLFNMMKLEIPTEEMKNLLDDLWKKYPKGLVVNVDKGDVPERSRGLAGYLAKYLASPPISVRRIVSYDGKQVTYWYKDHETKKKKIETVEVYTFIGRMVQHIFPKGFQRIRYFGLQATTTFKKWCEIIKERLKRVGRVVKGAYQILEPKRYRDRSKEVSGADPMICKNCGHEMVLWKIWHPKYGVILDEYKNLKSGKYDEIESSEGFRRSSVRSSTPLLQLSLFQMPN